MTKKEKIMIRLSLITLIFLLNLTSSLFAGEDRKAVQDSPPEPPPFQLSLKTDKAIYGLGEEIKISYSIKNISSQTEAYYDGQIHFRLLDKDGNALKPREGELVGFQESMYWAPYDFDYYTFEPGKTREGESTLGAVKFKEVWDPLWTEGGKRARVPVFRYSGVVMSKGGYHYTPPAGQDNGIFIQAEYCTSDPTPKKYAKYDKQYCEENKARLEKAGFGFDSDSLTGLSSSWGAQDLYRYCEKYDYLHQPAWQGCLKSEPVKIRISSAIDTDDAIKSEDDSFTQERHFKDGRLDGPAKNYYKTGGLAAEFTFKNGKLEGDVKHYYEDGQLWAQMHFVDGLLQGEVTEYYEDGKVRKQAFFKDSRQEGAMTRFDRSKDGPTWIAMTGEYRDNKKDGMFKFCGPDGELRSEDSYKEGKLNGKSKSYFTNGSISGEGMYTDGKKDGLFKSYYPDGTLKVERDYKDGAVQAVRQFNRNGKLLLHHEYFCPENALDNRRYDIAAPLEASLFLDEIDVSPSQIVVKLRDDFKENLPTDDFTFNKNFEGNTLTIPRPCDFKQYNPVFCYTGAVKVKDYDYYSLIDDETIKNSNIRYCMKIEESFDGSIRFSFATQTFQGREFSVNYGRFKKSYKSYMPCNQEWQGDEE